MVKKAYLGIDVGSVSLKMALIDDKAKVIKSVYLRNQGVIDTLKKALTEIQMPDYEVAGVGVTGSGRKFVGMMVGADVIKTEILAHTIAALHYYPNVRTLIDIGGEDSKLMVVNNGVLENFVLNNICSAGTGSYLESIAIRMGLKIEEVAEIALQSTQRIDLSTKCGVFMQSSVVTKLNTGHSKSDVLMGVVRSLVHNYLTMAKGIDLKPPFVYQSATAKNKAIVKAFEEELGHEVIVPENCDVMGAVGMALITLKERAKETTKFKGFEIKDNNYKIKNIVAKGCDNRCEMTWLYDGGDYVGCIGNRCDKCAPKNGDAK